MFIPDDCPHLAGIKMSLPNHKEELYKGLETPRMERGYRWFLQALFSKAEEQLTNEREQVTGSESRRVVDHRYVEKGKSVIQVEDPVHENTNQVPNPRDQLEGIDGTPNVMGNAHVTRKLRKMVKDKNVVRGEQIDQGRLSQRSGPGNNLFPRKQSEHVEKGEARSKKGLKRPAARTCTVTENRYDRGYSAQRLKEGEEQSRKKLKKAVTEERESSVEIVASSPPRSTRRQLGNNSQVQSSAKVITRQLRNVEVGESSRPKKNICKNIQRKESDDEDASDLEILDSTAVFEGNLGPFVPSKMYKGDASTDNGRANVLSEFRVNVLNVLKKPFDKQEYHRLQELVQKGSYLETYPDFRVVLVKHEHIKAKCLNILRGFFFWLQNLPQEGAFEPWNDGQCLSVKQESDTAQHTDGLPLAARPNRLKFAPAWAADYFT